MSKVPSGDMPDGPDPDDAVGDDTIQMLALHVERVVVTKRTRRTLVKAIRHTVTRDEPITAELHHEHVIVERVAVGRVVDAVPAIRQEGSVTIIPVVEEELVLVRRLVLKEEVHLRRVSGVTSYGTSVPVREQHVDVTWTKLED